ncbi:MAG: hypothetical protein JRI72_02930, partial [Deltaproteobacteria bacterium]|nr:hypothetical protein [Deltaproteobacteria bacterium]
NFRGYAGYIDKMRPLVNLTAFITRQTRIGFSEVTGGRALSFCNVSMGEIPLEAGRGAEKTSPRALELKKGPSSLRKYDVFKGLKMHH